MPVTDVSTDPQTLTMTVVSELHAPIERVWQAYCDPRQLERFWGPPGWPARFTAFDHEVGGHARYTMLGPHGERSSGSWEFLEIDEPSRFAVIDRFVDDDGSPIDGLPSMRMDFTFEPIATGTRMVAITHFESLAALETVVSMGAVEGTQLAMNQLDAVLSDLRSFAEDRGTRIELLTDTHVRITRLVDGPLDLVWRAHRDPDLIRRWLLGPDGWEMTHCIAATSPGQVYLNAWAPTGDTEGVPFGFEGELLLSEPPIRQVTTERMQGTESPTTLNDLSLYSEDGATLITLLIEYPDKETRDMILATGMVDGMEASYGRLEREILKD